MRVLVVDPNAAEREVTVRTLTAEKHEVESAKDATTAIAALDKRRPDVVLVEATMPGVSGHELVKRLRAAEDPATHLYVVITAAKPMPFDLKNAFAAGADDFIRKPMNKEELVLRVEGAARIKTWMQRVQGKATALDLTEQSCISAAASWLTGDAAICSDVGDMLGMVMTPTPATAVMNGATVGASLPLTMVSESLEVRVGVAADAESARILGAAMLGSEDAAESDIRDMLREIANVAAGCFKRLSGVEGRILTTGLPLNGAPSTFSCAAARARKEWTAGCGDTGATLRFELQYMSIENKHVPVHALREGMVLAHDLVNPSGALLMRGGTRLTENHLNQIPRVLADGALVAIMAAAA